MQLVLVKSIAEVLWTDRAQIHHNHFTMDINGGQAPQLFTTVEPSNIGDTSCNSYPPGMPTITITAGIIHLGHLLAQAPKFLSTGRARLCHIHACLPLPQLRSITYTKTSEPISLLVCTSARLSMLQRSLSANSYLRYSSATADFSTRHN